MTFVVEPNWVSQTRPQITEPESPVSSDRLASTAIKGSWDRFRSDGISVGHDPGWVTLTERDDGRANERSNDEWRREQKQIRYDVEIESIESTLRSMRGVK
ncbi:hypothetical protein VFPPC_14243 [Pochonia chlamydosporia 170]|uniref:Uncharacterized protein n=1 Tax=Pochonia chlamydosporia 170 TaxID=1380566 RepID=A0A179FJV9_METCM|nr:hypothetical protein VFPPC_14243 [Pochonia chlamydosporia 170]OAQ65824.1 hypothetical protein VFPPC_14243 [Pochonia chlamydosporia 170]